MLGINNDKLQNTHAKVYIIHNKLSRLQNHPGDPGSLLNLMKDKVTVLHPVSVYAARLSPQCA